MQKVEEIDIYKSSLMYSHSLCNAFIRPRTSLSNIRSFNILICKKCWSASAKSSIFETCKRNDAMYIKHTWKGEPRENKFNYTLVLVALLFC